jgi:hypothetical protein
MQTQAIATDIAFRRLRHQRCGSEKSHDYGANPLVTMVVLIELGVAAPVPTLKAPTVSCQTQRGFRTCAETGLEDGGGEAFTAKG